MYALFNAEQRLAVLYHILVVYKNCLYYAVIFALNFIHQLHCLNDAEDLSLFHGIACFNIRLCIRGRGAIESTY